MHTTPYSVRSIYISFPKRKNENKDKNKYKIIIAITLTHFSIPRNKKRKESLWDVQCWASFNHTQFIYQPHLSLRLDKSLPSPYYYFSMLVLHYILYALLGTGIAFAIIELGLSAYVAAIWGGTYEAAYWDPVLGYEYGQVHVSTPGILIFLVFASCWTILISAAALLLPWFYTRKASVRTSMNAILGVGLAAVYFATMVFWLACFADIATMLGGGTSLSSYLNAVIAFAVLLWYVCFNYTALPRTEDKSNADNLTEL